MHVHGGTHDGLDGVQEANDVAVAGHGYFGGDVLAEGGANGVKRGVNPSMEALAGGDGVVEALGSECWVTHWCRVSGGAKVLVPAPLLAEDGAEEGWVECALASDRVDVGDGCVLAQLLVEFSTPTWVGRGASEMGVDGESELLLLRMARRDLLERCWARRVLLLRWARGGRAAHDLFACAQPM